MWLPIKKLPIVDEFSIVGDKSASSFNTEIFIIGKYNLAIIFAFESSNYPLDLVLNFKILEVFDFGVLVDKGESENTFALWIDCMIIQGVLDLLIDVFHWNLSEDFLNCAKSLWVLKELGN